MSEPPESSRLGAVSLRQLRAMRHRLEAEAGPIQARLDALEARKAGLEQEGAARRSTREQQAFARRLADLDREAEKEAGLLRFVGRQQALLDHLVAAREDAERWQALSAAAPAAMALDWADLVAAAADATAADGAEADLEGLLRLLGVPEEEWPKAPPPPSSSGPSTSPGTPPAGPALVVDVPDGRSLRLSTGETVRYIGVDAPLLRGSLGHPEAGAEEARSANRRLVEGRSVRLEADALDRDPDGALWRTVWVGKTCVNAELIRNGVAYHLPQSPNYRHMEWFARLEAEARRKKRGVWR